MDTRNYRIEFVVNTEATSVDEALELAREAVLTEYMDVFVNGEQVA